MSGEASAAGAYPQPRADDDNRAYLDGWRAGRLMLQRCRACGHVFHYPRPACPACFAADLEWFEAKGSGTIVSFSLITRPNDPAFNGETPIVLCEITLAEKATMLARVLTADPSAVAAGARVALLRGDACKRYPLPIFELAR